MPRRETGVGDRGCTRRGGLILVPKLSSSLHAASSGAVGGWRKPPALYEPFALFNKATGSFAFPILAALAIWGVVRGWRRGARDPIAFALLWMWAPPLMMLAASYTIAPVFVERYALSSFVPFFILAALGIFELPGDLVRAASARTRSRILARPYRLVRSQATRRAISRSNRGCRLRAQAGRGHDRRSVVRDRSTSILSSA